MKFLSNVLLTRNLEVLSFFASYIVNELLQGHLHKF